MNNLINKKLKVINIGIEEFAESIKKSGGEVISIDFKPPRIITNEELKYALKKVEDNIEKIERANKEFIDRLFKSKIYLIGIGKALEVIPGMHKDMILHAGPDIEWDRMCGPMKGAIIGALIYEGRAKDEKEAEEIASSGDIEFSPCHHHNSVGPMAGIISPSMPVFILINKEFGNRAFCTLNEGLGKVLRYGAYSNEVIERLKWMEKVLAPALKSAIEGAGEIDIKNIIAQALYMGDELHNRNRAATSLFIRTIAPYLVRKVRDEKILESILRFIDSNDHFFLNLSMPACKAMLEICEGIENCSIVTVMARNGTEFGIKVSGLKDRWFKTEAPIPRGLFFGGYTQEDANRDIGDSAITETAGLGGFAIASAPAIVQFVGGSPSDAINYSNEMFKITYSENNIFKIPYLNFKGTPTGIDIIKVVKTGITPIIDTGIAHKKAGIGQIGAGILRAPLKIFEDALIQLAKNL